MKLKFVGANSAILLILIPAAAWGSDTANPKSDILSIEYRHERLKVVADNVPLSLAMLAIADKTGLEIHGIEFLKGNIKTSFFSFF